ncbi:CorA family divalent cation transporter [Catalinimonas niigatensis]|uniref:CorA family divalent cation transporter n=1 Tax=Catalinimonas niigatensis TaxID=1397264 RepID=UPI0026658673|nr:CorA family divalent cation transporter [Catalinimonas niigatensis]WPP49162.1 CorA family divalent cation transporter [Catalinimonas niigatensis]
MSKTVKPYGNFEWIDLEKPDQEELKTLTEPFNMDINLLEDSLEPGHLPKIEKVNNYTFIILRAYSANFTDNVTTVEELSNKIAFFINENRLITIHRAEFDFLEHLTDHYNNSESLMLSIIDEMIFTYEKPLQIQSEKMDEFEREIFLKNGNAISIESLYYQKSKARISKKVFQLTQSVLNQIPVKPESNSILQDLKDTTLSYLLQSDEVIEDANTLLNSYLSVTAQKNNDVMKLLTIFSAFFLPLTFIAGIYGMNFNNMPELRWQNGYYITLGVMLSISIIIYAWFKRKKIM